MPHARDWRKVLRRRCLEAVHFVWYRLIIAGLLSYYGFIARQAPYPR